MKTSLNSIEETEQFLNGQLAPEDRLLYQARMIVEEGLEERTRWQKKTYEVINAYGRMQLRNQLLKIHEQLMNESPQNTFRNKILHFFSR